MPNEIFQIRTVDIARAYLAYHCEWRGSKVLSAPLRREGVHTSDSIAYATGTFMGQDPASASARRFRWWTRLQTAINRVQISAVMTRREHP